MDDSFDAEAKRLLRGRLKAELRAEPPTYFERAGVFALARLRVLPQWRAARAVFAFLSMRGEIETDGICRAVLDEGKALLIPRVAGAELVFCRVSAADGPWASGPFGIREPLPDSSAADPAMEAGPLLVLAPGLAFDERGGRLGRGKGYYDRFIRALRRSRSDTYVVGLCTRVQLVAEIPLGPNDEAVDMVLAC